MLEGKYEAAVEALRHALQLEPHSPALLTDLATAYFQRAQQEDNKDDLGAAYEYLSQALKLHPDDPVALFNRAIVAEHQFLYHQALDDWDHYLRVDPGSQWAEEARNRANAVREKLKQHGSKMSRCFLRPQLTAALADASLEPRSLTSPSLINASKNICTKPFAPGCLRPFLKVRTTADSDAAQALFFLAELTEPASRRPLAD